MEFIASKQIAEGEQCHTEIVAQGEEGRGKEQIGALASQLQHLTSMLCESNKTLFSRRSGDKSGSSLAVCSAAMRINFAAAAAAAAKEKRKPGKLKK